MTKRLALVCGVCFVATVAFTAIATDWLFALKQDRYLLIFYDYFSPTVIPMSICVFLLFCYRGAEGQSGVLFSTFSRATFGVYLMHPLVLQVLVAKLTFLLAPGATGIVLAVLLVVVFSFCVSIGIGRVAYLSRVIG